MDAGMATMGVGLKMKAGRGGESGGMVTNVYGSNPNQNGMNNQTLVKKPRARQAGVC
jgi:hypothetical protein